jgi:hypothetical protein
MDWFANKGQVIQIALAAATLSVAAVKAYPDFRNNNLLSAGTLLFWLSLSLVAVSIILLIRPTRQLQPDRAARKLAEAEFGALNLAEKLALRMFLQDRRTTDEQIQKYLESLGFFGSPVNMFTVLRQKTRFMDSDFAGTNGIRTEYVQLVRQLLKGPLV